MATENYYKRGYCRADEITKQQNCVGYEQCNGKQCNSDGTICGVEGCEWCAGCRDKNNDCNPVCESDTTRKDSVQREIAKVANKLETMRK